MKGVRNWITNYQWRAFKMIVIFDIVQNSEVYAGEMQNWINLYSITSNYKFYIRKFLSGYLELKNKPNKRLVTESRVNQNFYFHCIKWIADLDPIPAISNYLYYYYHDISGNCILHNNLSLSFFLDLSWAMTWWQYTHGIDNRKRMYPYIYLLE